MSQFLLPNTWRNRPAILSTLKKHLGLKNIKELIETCENEVGKMILKLYFRASSYQDRIVSGLDSSLSMAFFDSFSNDALNNSNYSPSTKTQLIIKAFKLGEEIDRIFEGIEIPEASLMKLTDSLATLLTNKQNLIPGPTAIYSVYKMMRRLSSKKRERQFITRRLLLSSRQPRLECFDALLQAQLHSPEIDWDLHRDLLSRTREFPRIQNILNEFEADYRIS